MKSAYGVIVSASFFYCSFSSFSSLKRSARSAFSFAFCSAVFCFLILEAVVLSSFHLMYSNVVIPFLCSMMWNQIRCPRNRTAHKLKNMATPIATWNSAMITRL